MKRILELVPPDDDVKDSTVNVDFADDARKEIAAIQRPLTDSERVEILRRCNNVKDVDTHKVNYRAEQWQDLLHVFPDPAAHDGVVTRGQVRDAVQSALVRGDHLDLLIAVYIWGQGRNGYGRHRFETIVNNRREEVDRKLTTALTRLVEAGPIEAYAQLWGGDGRSDGVVRASHRSTTWSRVQHLGPAFFTKVLYFADRDALILDQVLARKVRDLSNLEHFVGKRGRALAWTPYRYAVYLEWMRQTAAELSSRAGVEITPDTLELALFAPRGDTASEGDAAH